MKQPLHASKMRLRPIIMTTLAFGFRCFTIGTASGAGAGSQHSVGYGVLGGAIFQHFRYFLHPCILRVDS